MGRIAALTVGIDSVTSPIAREIHHIIVVLAGEGLLLLVKYFSVQLLFICYDFEGVFRFFRSTPLD